MCWSAAAPASLNDAVAVKEGWWQGRCVFGMRPRPSVRLTACLVGRWQRGIVFEVYTAFQNSGVISAVLPPATDELQTL